MAHASDESFATNLYYDRGFESPAAKVLPGEYYATNQDMMIVTVLGSCVTACIRDRDSGIGGLNHFMLPESGSDDGTMSRPARYGTYAMEVLINHILKMGARRERLEAKVFGGGNVLAGLTVANVGERNAAFVLKFLQTDRIPVVARDLVDIYPRKVYYFPRTGKVMVKKLRDSSRTIIERERVYGSRLEERAAPADVELFS